MQDGIFLGFDFGYKRIGVAIGQKITATARPLTTLKANLGVPNWQLLEKIIAKFTPCALIVGLPVRIDGSEQYTTKASREFANQLHELFLIDVHMVDERLSTVEARSQLFAEGGYRKLQKSQIDCFAACVILEQWLQSSNHI